MHEYVCGGVWLGGERGSGGAVMLGGLGREGGRYRSAWECGACVCVGIE